MSQPKKIAVLGGGLSAITSVFHLLQDPDWKNKYDITVYQMGWRIGGKGASGVNINNGCRIEEHGLHLWMGFYENAFSMMRTIYEANKRSPKAPLATFDDAFKGQPYMVFAEKINEQWQDWKLPFPKINGQVGDGVCGDFANLIESIFDDILNKIKEHFESERSKPHVWKNKTFDHLIPSFLKRDIDIIRNDIEKVFATAAAEFFHIICQLLIKLRKIESEYFKHLTNLIDGFKKWIWDELGEKLNSNNTARHLWISIDMITALFRGLLNDDMFELNNDVIQINFDKINNYDYAEWFLRHGADKKLTVESPLITSMYDGPFAFIKGNINNPNIEAGTTLRNFFRLSFTCKENITWRMQAGMGDTIFGPAYELMSRMYGVKFKFFSRVQNLKLSADKKRVQQIEISNQVRLKNDNYDPLYKVNGLNCWPSEPLYGQLNLEDADALKSGNINLESSWTEWKDTGGITTLEFGKDYDAIILGASLGSMPLICSELIENNVAWKNMVNKVLTVQTQAYQFWLNKSPEELGVEPQKLLSCYVEPLDTYAEMNHLLIRENWPADANVKYISYLCGAFPDAEIIPPYSDHSFPSKEQARAQQRLSDYFNKNLQHIIPGAFKNNQFDWNLLVDLKNSKGEERLNAQYIRANIDPSERYVMSVTDSSRFRIKTNETGYDNLFITGDWTRNHFNSGFVECAVVAGILTARAISGNNNIPIYLPSWDKIDF